FQRLSGEKFLYQDQDILNIVCRGKTAFFDQRYNLRPNTYATGDFGPENVIIHYVGDKPWHTFTYAWAQWWEACERTIFFDGDLYREISRQVLSTRHSIKKSIRHTKIKLQILSRLVGK
ncbi:MAG: hypothetical protein J1E97_03265, partial [Muribaculaceae bacterium]|nr:hypothetical protein [Muribaculaceae bacterium]